MTRNAAKQRVEALMGKLTERQMLSAYKILYDYIVDQRRQGLQPEPGTPALLRLMAELIEERIGCDQFNDFIDTLE